ncbi:MULTISPECIES: hypothetical protein [unclassified Streptomyces]|uniref:hypothetical protein n=1 Tax=Streptomyces sp. NPDC127129 TaxID=3345373 RepID=UPI00362A4B96
MSSTARTVRALAALAALMGVVFGLLVCGAGTASASAGPVAGASEAALADAAAAGAVEAGAAVAGAAEAGAGRVPGCGEGHTADGAARPATPPRPNGFGELLPTLAGERAAGGLCGADQVIRELLPGPEPPELVPPSPVELSILRV